ncbi:plastocyanin/azurin family copper-binding protein [Planktothrix mougeotii]|uniref:Biphenyl 2,3-dioxygenase n=1 Tax=Planktothrix mougeotii LEGE 06226 TaxID=1828728 RepID=A0ABR9U7L9_9CYAN|nr:plastocyanin/azurin family copper-binding protein [Planktothrix mougeotii]MBE9141811.1 biphenyl 2,3-dioxygenase [Planktothrix mougeotii LEGE 06226]
MIKFNFDFKLLFKQISVGLGVLLILILGLNAILMQPAFAGVDLSRQPATEVTVSLSNESGELKFFPDHFQFEAGKPYKLILKNPSPGKHYFTAKDFADMSWTQKVESGKLEVKGAIHDLELKPGGEATWVFVPIRTGTYSLRCSIPGHTEAGMKGEIMITENS